MYKSFTSKAIFVPVECQVNNHGDRDLNKVEKQKLFGDTDA